MGEYKGNVGHLMQHWTLCKMLTVASRQPRRPPGLNYIDAYAMAPWATHCPKPTREFSCVRKCLPGQQSAYERAWHSIANLHPNEDGYPSSAAFVHELWIGSHSLLLCESDNPTADEIQTWLDGIQPSSGCTYAKLLRGDWRHTLANPLPSPRDVGLPENALTLVSFDPDRYNRDPNGQNRRHLYPKDLQQTLQALQNIDGGVLMQVSTYSRGNENQDPQEEVVSSVDAILTTGGFTRAARVWANGDMMSLVYARGVAWVPMLAELPQQFDKWRRACR